MESTFRTVSKHDRIFAFVCGSLFVLALFCLQLLRTRQRDDLRDVPGPFIASFSNFLKVKAACQGNIHKWNQSLHKRYGSVVRIGPQHVSFSSPEAFSIIHASRQAYAKVSILIRKGAT